LFQNNAALFNDNAILFHDKTILFNDNVVLFQNNAALFNDNASRFDDNGALFNDNSASPRNETTLFTSNPVSLRRRSAGSGCASPPKAAIIPVAGAIPRWSPCRNRQVRSSTGLESPPARFVFVGARRRPAQESF